MNDCIASPSLSYNGKRSIAVRRKSDPSVWIEARRIRAFADKDGRRQLSRCRIHHCQESVVTRGKEPVLLHIESEPGRKLAGLGGHRALIASDLASVCTISLVSSMFTSTLPPVSLTGYSGIAPKGINFSISREDVRMTVMDLLSL